MEFLDRDDDKTKEYREKLMGQNVIDSAPSEYWELQMTTSMEGSLAIWDTLPIHKKAKLRAYYQLNNMVELLRQHQQNMKEARKAAIDKAKADAKKT